MANLAGLQKALGVSFKNPHLLKQALSHSSYINENPGLAPASNERLEFLGDAILNLIVAETLYRDLPESDEGDMTKRRSVVVRRDALVRVAQTIGLGDYLYFGKGEEASGGRKKPINLAGAVEAVIGAIFLDQGLVATTGVVIRLFNEELEKVIKLGGEIDYKSELQELIQARRQQTPSYHVIDSSGKDEARRFTAEVRAGDSVLGKGSGKSKKAAETEAARAALAKLSRLFTR